VNRHHLAGLVSVLIVVALGAPAMADEDGCSGTPDPLGIAVSCVSSKHVSEAARSSEFNSAGIIADGAAQYAWVPACSGNVPRGELIPGADCSAATTSCPAAGQFLWALWTRPLRSTGGGNVSLGPWSFVVTACLGANITTNPTAAAIPRVTWQMVLNAVRRVGLPALTVQVQPANETLVNFDTIFYAEPSTFTRTLTMLGRTVDVEAQPAEYHWHFGDGAVATTTTPGAPYPAKTIVHQYADAHVTLHPSVDVLYSVRFRVDQGAWQGIAERIDIPGPAVDLRTREATPVLSGQG
jgi:hypothetical protein